MKCNRKFVPTVTLAVVAAVGYGQLCLADDREGSDYAGQFKPLFAPAPSTGTTFRPQGASSGSLWVERTPSQDSASRHQCPTGWSNDGLSLQGYVDPSFARVVQKLDYDGDPKGALRLLSGMKLPSPDALAQAHVNEVCFGVLRNRLNPSDLYRRLIAAEAHYIKGVCQQLLENFHESANEYRQVQKLSPDDVLVKKAIIGEQLAEQKQRNLDNEQIRFPGEMVSRAPDIF